MSRNHFKFKTFLAVSFILEVQCRGIARFGGRGSGIQSNYIPTGRSDPRNYQPAGYNVYQSTYGNLFGWRGLPTDTHIYSDSYKIHNSATKKFLAEHLFKRENDLKSSSKLGEWTETDDRRWRFTTKAPYFQNESPRSRNILPAAAVVGAATAFGLVTLLPLNVPEGQPLMYCPDVNFDQSAIELDGKTYSCVGSEISVVCMSFENDLASTNTDSTSEKPELCVNETVRVGLKFSDGNLYYHANVLKSESHIVCDAATKAKINCFYGKFPLLAASFIPTTESPTTKTEKPDEVGLMGFLMRSVFFKWLGIGETDSESKAISEIEESYWYQNYEAWVPEAFPVEL